MNDDNKKLVNSFTKPLTNSLTKPLPNKHLLSWKEDLHKKINCNEEKMLEMARILKSLEEKNIKEDGEIDILEKTMGNTLDNVEKDIENYSNTIIEKIKLVKKCGKEERGKELFKLYKDMYQDAREFFSRRDFKYEKSSLNMKNDQSLYPQTILNCLTSFFEESDNNDWADVLIPIWSLEQMYNDMEIKHTDIYKIHQDLQKKYQYKKKIYENLNGEINNMKQELEELKDFSSRIRNR